MRLTRFRLFGLAALAAASAVAACRDENVTTANRPPLAGVRYINAVNDTGRLDFRMVDQIQYSANTIAGAGGLQFRAGSEYFPTEAKARSIRVFSLADTLITTVQQVVHDTVITFEANKNYTLLFMGSARNNTDRFRVIEESPPATVAAGQVAVRVYNAAAAAVDAYLVPATTTAIPGGTAITNVATMTASNYVTRDTGNVAIRIANAGTTTAVASVAADRGTLGTTSFNPVAGSAVPGTVMSAYVFPASVAGSRAPQTAAFLATGVQLFVDKLPPNTVAGSTP